MVAVLLPDGAAVDSTAGTLRMTEDVCSSPPQANVILLMVNSGGTNRCGDPARSQETTSNILHHSGSVEEAHQYWERHWGSWKQG